LVATFFAAALLAWARRERAALAEVVPFLDASLRGRLSTITVMWLVRLRIR
jgi:hypothetical protein